MQVLSRECNELETSSYHRKFSLFSEFKNRQQEGHFLLTKLAGIINPAGWFSCSGDPVFLFIIPDYFLTQNKTIFCLILAIRGLFCCW